MRSSTPTMQVSGAVTRLTVYRAVSHRLSAADVAAALIATVIVNDENSTCHGRPVLICEIFVMNSFSTKPISLDAEVDADHSKSSEKSNQFTDLAQSSIYA